MSTASRMASQRTQTYHSKNTRQAVYLEILKAAEKQKKQEQTAQK